jgi:acyl-CoA synthetase (AMP-forming)/AMP-acid ligase II
VAVIGIPDDQWGESVTALVVRAEGSAVTGDELIAHCKKRMAHFKAPRRVEFRTELTRTATGKLQKYKLREPFWSGEDRGVH